MGLIHTTFITSIILTILYKNKTFKELYTVSQKNWATFFTAYNFRNIEQIFTKFGTNQRLFMLNIVPEFIQINFGK